MGPAPGAPVPTEIPALHTGWGLRPPPISTSAAPWGWRAGRGAHFLQIIQQVHVQQVDVLARSDLHRGLFDVVLQLPNDLETAPRAQCEPSHLVTLRPAQDGGLFSEEGGSHSPSPAYHMKSRPRAPPQAPPIRAPPHGVPPPPPEAPPPGGAPPTPLTRLRPTCSKRCSSLVASGCFCRLASSCRMLSNCCPRRRTRWVSTLCTFTRSKTYLRSFSRATCVGERGPRVGAQRVASPSAPGLQGGTLGWETRSALPPAPQCCLVEGCTGWVGLRGPARSLTSIVQRQCASLMGTSFPQALAMVRWSYCVWGGGSRAEGGRLGAAPLPPPAADPSRHSPWASSALCQPSIKTPGRRALQDSFQAIPAQM